MEDTGIVWKLRETGRIRRNIVQNSMETYGSNWKLLVLYMAWARLTPTLTHVVTRDPMTSGAEDRAMSPCTGYSSHASF